MEIGKINEKSNNIIGLYNLDLSNKDNVYYIKDEMYTTSVLNEIKYHLNIKRLSNKNTKALLDDVFEIFKLNEKFLYKKIDELSYSEKIIVSIIISYLIDSKYIVYNNLFKKLDKDVHKKLKTLFINQKAQDKVIIFESLDIDLLYEMTDYIFIKTEDGVVEGDTKEILKDYEMLEKNNIKVPKLIEITYLAKKNKDVKLFYHTDVRDIIKDIYKHV